MEIKAVFGKYGYITAATYLEVGPQASSGAHTFNR
jgi:hypothetical protein